MQWFYSRNDGTQHGPVSLDELVSLVNSGSVKSSDLAWREGLEQWQPVSAIPELRSHLPGSNIGAGAPPLPPAADQNPFAPPVSPIMPGATASVPNYLWQSILVTLLCCLPLGIPAIVYASNVDSLLREGRVQEARSASASAKMWCWIAFGLGFGLMLLYFIAVLATGAASAAAGAGGLGGY